MQHTQPEPRNIAGLTAEEQVLMNTAGIALLREHLNRAGSNLDGDWLNAPKTKRVAICAIARQPWDSLMMATLSALPYQQREAIRLAVIALDYQSLFHSGCDPKVWHPSVKVTPAELAERNKREQAKRQQLDHAVHVAGQIGQEGPRPIGH
ncbi:hypothetical protein [Aeromonas allosaccharophila]|uniref:hypothetical protein n=1 Tax=Aeromonas allosaccharophila TaxID=656 RepID=UPI000DD05EB7|nr:hypothetical protein [Aeromonas allosaccharophila]